MLNPELVQAYRETECRVFTEPVLVLRVGERSDGLEALHQHHGVTCSAFITAFNPFSEGLPDDLNAMHQAQWMAQLHAKGQPFIEGVGMHPSGDWPGEDSVLILGMGLDAASALGRQLGQNEFVRKIRSEEDSGAVLQE